MVAEPHVCLVFIVVDRVDKHILPPNDLGVGILSAFELWILYHSLHCSILFYAMVMMMA